MREVVGDLERRLVFEPGHHGNPKAKNRPGDLNHWGVAAMRMRFLLVGPHGATQFLLGTGWYLPETYRWWLDSGRMPPGRFGGPLNELDPRHGPAMPADLGYHAYEPRYEDQSSYECDVLANTERCYYDGSGLNAEPVFDRLLREGEDGVWAELWDYYRSLFDGEPIKAGLEG